MLDWPHGPFAFQKWSMASYFRTITDLIHVSSTYSTHVPKSNIHVTTIYAFYNIWGCPVPSPLLWGFFGRCPFWTRVSTCSWQCFDAWCAGWVPGWCCGQRGLGWEPRAWARPLVAGINHYFFSSRSTYMFCSIHYITFSALCDTGWPGCTETWWWTWSRWAGCSTGCSMPRWPLLIRRAEWDRGIPGCSRAAAQYDQQTSNHSHRQTIPFYQCFVRQLRQTNGTSCGTLWHRLTLLRQLLHMLHSYSEHA